MWARGEKDSQDSEEEEHQQKAGPQGLCGDDSEKASISEQFSIGEDRAGDSGDVQYLECWLTSMRAHVWISRAHLNPIWEDASIIPAFL